MAGLVTLPAPAHAATAAHHPRTATTTTRDPLGVTIDQLTPSSLTPDATRGTIRVSGTITNDDADTWQAINVHAFIGSTPLTTETELTEASLSDPAQDVGNRITSYGDFATIPELPPGQSTTYSLTIPRTDLRDSVGNQITAPGVYWFGIQVLGTDTEGRDAVADGRARTFLPLVDRTAHPGQSEQTALVVPLRQRVLHQPDGTIASTDAWAKRLSPEGRLTRLLDFGADHPVSWLVDPAVIAAVQQLADGNPPRSLAPTDGSPDPAQPDAKPSARHSASTDATATLAKAWLDRLLDTLKRSEVYALPYGDLDLAAAARHDPSWEAIARRRSTATFASLGITATPIDAPIDGYLQPAAVTSGDTATKLLLSDRAISGTVPAVATIGDRSVITTSSLVAAGGPPPGDHLGLVPVRQELLAQAALRLGTGDPVIAVLPASWSPAGDSAGFFAGLARRWVQPGTVFSATLGSAGQDVETSRLRYPDAEIAAELPAATFTAVAGLRTAGRTLQSVLRHNTTVATTVLDEALTNASYTARGGARGAAAERSREAISSMLRSIEIEAPPAVTLSSDRGRFNATVVNGLDEDISVRVVPVADNGMRVSGPHRLTLPAKSRSGVLLTARARTNGVHTVVLKLTDPDGTALGSRASVPIRTAQVSRIIWLFIACGLGLLFAAIIVRLIRRVRRAHRSGDDPDAAAERDPDHDPDHDPEDVR